MSINIFDKNFMPYSESSTLGKSPKTFTYERGVVGFDGVTLFTDHCYPLVRSAKSKYNIAWQVESPIHSRRQFYQMVNGYSDAFDMIFTYDEALIARDPDKFKRCNFGGTTVVNPNLNTELKTKDVAIVHSGKRDTPNHYMRELVTRMPNVDVFGKITGRPFDNIADVLAPYRYSIIIENINSANYFSEKLTDCIACGCVPIYNGCTNIDEYFNPFGIPTFDSIGALERILENITDAYPSVMAEGLLENFNKLDQYYTNEDWLYEEYVKGVFS